MVRPIRGAARLKKLARSASEGEVTNRKGDPPLRESGIARGTRGVKRKMTQIGSVEGKTGLKKMRRPQRRPPGRAHRSERKGLRGSEDAGRKKEGAEGG